MAGETGLSLTLSETPKTGFVLTRPNWKFLSRNSALKNDKLLLFLYFLVVLKSTIQFFIFRIKKVTDTIPDLSSIIEACHFLVISRYFSKLTFSELLSECQIVWIEIRLDILTSIL